MNEAYPLRRSHELLRAAWGGWLLIAPRQALRRVGGRTQPDRRSVAITRVLGGRQLVQAGLSGLRPSPAVLAVGAWVDGVHAMSAAALAAFDRRRERTAGLDAVVAAFWCALGRRDIPAAEREGAATPGWQDRVAQEILPLLPGAPAAHLTNRQRSAPVVPRSQQ